ncbi:hypothetical protein SAM23877_7370 [Streptomyces ambofaciens ATCC 23877]|uniref:Uncharacterized protein n=1 Tax=Streptomyces ambofaciens (strain ATCC 23877 / 3486 / DSM 40053 / JCM 4204 / NBRC 12836 / NRRL B-2516) TaxID=278992 RepID=A0A0K2B5I9_STRA7|nr:hypothetical protein SAM23877_7370 [Streptomyces ambofaciens ATCC 23877]
MYVPLAITPLVRLPPIQMRPPEKVLSTITQRPRSNGFVLQQHCVLWEDSVRTGATSRPA